MQHSSNLAPASWAGITPHDRHVLEQQPEQAHAGRSLGASNDLQAIGVWLAQYAGQKNTLAAYRREANRLLLWCAKIKHKPLHQLVLEDYLAYHHFLQNPPPEWVGPRHSINHPQWKPLSGGLSAGAARQAMIILNSLTSFLYEAHYLLSNPLGLARRIRRSEDTYRGRDRSLDGPMREAVARALRGQAGCGVSRMQSERTRVVFALGAYAGLRVSEIANVRESDFIIREITGDQSAWLKVEGKGGKKASIPLLEPAVQAVARYRGFLGESAWPSSGKDALLLRPMRSGHGGPLHRSSLYRDVKRVFKRASESLEAADGLRAKKLAQATPHSLRHTFVTLLLDSGVPLERARAMARHANVNTTLIYASEDAEFLLKSTQGKLKAWCLSDASA